LLWVCSFVGDCGIDWGSVVETRGLGQDDRVVRGFEMLRLPAGEDAATAAADGARVEETREAGGRAVEVGDGVLQGVEGKAGALVVDGFSGEAGEDFAEGCLDLSSVGEEWREGEGFGWDDVDGGIDAVTEAEVLIVHGVLAAAASVGPVHALVRFEWLGLRFLKVIHFGYSPLVWLRMWLKDYVVANECGRFATVTKVLGAGCEVNGSRRVRGTRWASGRIAGGG
jgi:hypothetical protein